MQALDPATSIIGWVEWLKAGGPYAVIAGLAYAVRVLYHRHVAMHDLLVELVREHTAASTELSGAVSALRSVVERGFDRGRK